MGERFRLKASFDISTYPAEIQVILRAMKKYGIIPRRQRLSLVHLGKTGSALGQRQSPHTRATTGIELRSRGCDSAAYFRRLGRSHAERL
jgi:hypothetical protein